MSDKQPEALQLADVVDVFDAQSEHMPLEIYGDISSELRRLHEVNQELLDELEKCQKELSAGMQSYWEDTLSKQAIGQARAAIAKATGENT